MNILLTGSTGFIGSNLLNKLKINNKIFITVRGKKRNTLRVFIDSDQNIDINDCENVSKDLSYEPDLDMYFGDNYVLEVSTPGIDRKFFDIAQLNSFVGEELEFRTKELINGSRKFSGKLVNCNTEEFSIENHKGSNILKFNSFTTCRFNCCFCRGRKFVSCYFYRTINLSITKYFNQVVFMS